MSAFPCAAGRWWVPAFLIVLSICFLAADLLSRADGDAAATAPASAPATAPANLQIVSATWKAGKQPDVDVTATLAARIQDGKLVTKVGAASLGVPSGGKGVTGSLSVTYRYNGAAPETLSVRGGGKTLQLPTPDDLAAAPPAPVVNDPELPPFDQAKADADARVLPADISEVWDDFLKGTPAPSDTEKQYAQDQLALLKPYEASGSERVAGKWADAAASKKMAADAKKICDEALDLLRDDKTLEGLPKIKQALEVYPNSYLANDLLAGIYFLQGDFAQAQTYARMCMNIHPHAVDALNNDACVLGRTGHLNQAIGLFYQAVQVHDDPILAFNLHKALAADPDKTSPGIVKAAAASALLSAKYQIPDLPARLWAAADYVMLPPMDDDSPDAGMLVSGSGFVVNADGFILTNRHVVKGMKIFEIVTADGKHMPAELVTVGTDQDLAILKISKIDPDATLSPVILSSRDYPAEGEQCYAVGYPLRDVLGASIKITQGIISGKADAENGVDILVDAKVNPGNSGGPLLDKFAQVIGVVSMKTLSDTEDDSYGMAISTGTVRKFLADNKIRVPAIDPGKPLDPEDVIKKVRAGTVGILAK